MHCRCDTDNEKFYKAPLGFKFRLIHEKFEQIVTQELQDLQQLNITYPQMMVLLVLDRSRDHRVTQKELAQELNVSRPTISGLLQRMSEKKLISQEPDPQNRRCRIISLLSEGEQILHTNHENKHQMEAFLTHGMTDAEKQELNHLLAKVYENLEQAVENQEERRLQEC